MRINKIELNDHDDYSFFPILYSDKFGPLQFNFDYLTKASKFVNYICKSFSLEIRPINIKYCKRHKAILNYLGKSVVLSCDFSKKSLSDCKQLPLKNRRSICLIHCRNSTKNFKSLLSFLKKKHDKQIKENFFIFFYLFLILKVTSEVSNQKIILFILMIKLQLNR